MYSDEWCLDDWEKFWNEWCKPFLDKGAKLGCNTGPNPTLQAGYTPNHEDEAVPLSVEIRLKGDEIEIFDWNTRTGKSVDSDHVIISSPNAHQEFIDAIFAHMRRIAEIRIRKCQDRIKTETTILRSRINQLRAYAKVFKNHELKEMPNG